MGLSNYLPSSRISQSGVCTSSTRPASPYEGQMIYETDTDKVLVWNGSAWRFLNTPQTTEPGVWTSFTPSWTNLTVGNGTVSAHYSIVNKILFVRVKFTMGSTSSMGDPLRMTLPASLTQNTDAQESIGWAQLTDTGVASYTGFVNVSSSTQVTIAVINASSTYGQTNNVNGTRPFTFATGDTVAFEFTTMLV